MTFFPACLLLQVIAYLFAAMVLELTNSDPENATAQKSRSPTSTLPYFQRKKVSKSESNFQRYSFSQDKPKTFRKFSLNLSEKSPVNNLKSSNSGIFSSTILDENENVTCKEIESSGSEDRFSLDDEGTMSPNSSHQKQDSSSIGSPVSRNQSTRSKKLLKFDEKRRCKTRLEVG